MMHIKCLFLMLLLLIQSIACFNIFYAFNNPLFLYVLCDWLVLAAELRDPTESIKAFMVTIVSIVQVHQKLVVLYHKIDKKAEELKHNHCNK